MHFLSIFLIIFVAGNMTQARQLPLHNVHLQLGAKMMPFAGFEMPVRYSTDTEEHLAVRHRVGIFDISHMGEFIVDGEEALSFLQHITSNDASLLTDGKAQYSCLPNEHGGIVDDIVVYRIHPTQYMLVVNSANIEKDWEWLNDNNHTSAKLTNISDDLCLFAVQGPLAKNVLQKLTDSNLDEVAYYHFVTTTFAGFPRIILSNTGYTGAGGFEVYLPAATAASIWNLIMEAGIEFEIKPIGLGARDTLRLEMGFCLYGNDIDDNTTPLEAGLGWITKFNKEFISVDTLRIQKEQGIKKKLVAFSMTERGIPRHLYPIVDSDGNSIGTVTSGTQSPSLKKGIGLGYVSISYSKPGTEIFIVIRDHKVKAVVSKLPFV